eukprot:TRINITY_DN49797_c0_g1_i1.p1 TRINITY_DN49797_c0_g1~~TRINITY_DN49797_c0_g1_i1.p1  ORF type:complete len:602 (+),score=43.30 TRINITY_DN49797_c0_g1_i1:53-1807(+)
MAKPLRHYCCRRPTRKGCCLCCCCCLPDMAKNTSCYLRTVIRLYLFINWMLFAMFFMVSIAAFATKLGFFESLIGDLHSVDHTTCSVTSGVFLALSAVLAMTNYHAVLLRRRHACTLLLTTLVIFVLFSAAGILGTFSSIFAVHGGSAFAGEGIVATCFNHALRMVHLCCRERAGPLICRPLWLPDGPCSLGGSIDEFRDHCFDLLQRHITIILTTTWSFTSVFLLSYITGVQLLCVACCCPRRTAEWEKSIDGEASSALGGQKFASPATSSTGVYESQNLASTDWARSAGAAGDGKFAYGNGDLVEYYSSTRRQWLLATLEVDEQGGNEEDMAHIDDDGAFTDAAYHVRVFQTSQVRRHIPLDMLRPPLQDAELVEVYSRRYGRWLPASIVGRPPRGPHRNYKALLLEAELPELQLTVPATRVRRRFPAGCSVHVYRGPPAGWVAAIVHSDVLSAPDEPPVPLSAYSPGGARSLRADMRATPAASARSDGDGSADDRESLAGSLAEDRASTIGTVCFGDDDVLLHPWVEVPIYHESFDHWLDPPVEEPAPEWVPSYLLRLQMLRPKGESEGPTQRNFARGFVI